MTDRSVSRQQEALIISGKRKRERMREEPRIKHIFFPAHLTRVYLIWRQQDAAFCFLWPVFTSRPPSSASLYEWLKAIQEYFMFDKMRQGQGLLLSSSKAERVSGETDEESHWWRSRVWQLLGAIKRVRRASFRLKSERDASWSVGHMIRVIFSMSHRSEISSTQVWNTR